MSQSFRPHLAQAHDHLAGAEPSDALLEDLARHYALTVYHETSTCRIGDVVDPRLRVYGIEALRVADASVMPNVVSGNTNAAAMMIGEKAAELIATDHGVHLHEVVLRLGRLAGLTGRPPTPMSGCSTRGEVTRMGLALGRI